VGRYLMRAGVSREEVVGIMLGRGIEMVVGMLAILKAGAAYLPIDVDYPSERKRYMLEDAGAKVILTTQEWETELEAQCARVICIDRDWDEIDKESCENFDNGVCSENLAYVIYTSGSTGSPKGVCVTHKAINRLVLNTNYVDINLEDRIAQVSSVSFDAATFEIWVALLNGARLVIMPRDISLSPKEFAARIRRQQIDTMFLTTALFNQVIREEPRAFQSLKHLLFGGEAVDPNWPRQSLKHGPPARLLHVYGPTENTTFSSWHLIDEVSREANTIPIGRAISNTTMYILDESLNPVPPGIAGELLVGGDGLARGYLNQPSLTAEKFIANPFADEPGTRLYRTGDQARFLPNGSVEFIGRRDHQVKIRGFRIEPGEIESLLASHAAVREVIVEAREDEPGDKRLVAYIVPAKDNSPRPKELREFARQSLPEYMVPSSYVLLEAFPLTANGKIDRQALPVPDRADIEFDEELIAPRDEIEAQLVHIWEDVLSIKPIGVRDNFFVIGGHSLLAIRLRAQIEKAFNQVIPTSALFRHPTVEKLASYLRSSVLPASGSPLVAIQIGGSNLPFFCVHPAGGNVFCYSELARSMGPDQPFYAFQARGLDGESAPHASIEEMAAAYCEAMLKIQPDGPYLIGGWSMGGVVAFEIARQIIARGQEVALLALIDSKAPGGDDAALNSNDLSLLAGFAQHLGVTSDRLARIWPDLLRLDSALRLSYILERARSEGLMPADLEHSHVNNLYEVFIANVRAMHNYIPQVIPFRVTLLRAGNGVSGSPIQRSKGKRSRDNRNLDLGWRRLAGKGLEIHVIPGDHFSIMREDHIEALAQQLRACLEAAQVEARSFAKV
jgi:amino acid adenylation domain-containing protein